MDFSVYITEQLVAVRLAELRAQSARLAAIAAARPSQAASQRVGAALVRLGRWLAGGDVPGQNAGVRVTPLR
jgi:hypothetical protein